MAWAFGLVTTSMATLSAGGRVLILARAEAGQATGAAWLRTGATFFAGVTTMFLVKLVGVVEDTEHPPDRRACGCASRAVNPATRPPSASVSLTGRPVDDVYAASEALPGCG